MCNPAAPTPITPTALDVKADEPQCSGANYTCVNNVTYCFSGAWQPCLEEQSCPAVLKNTS